ncbi:hypothetical protein ZYGR_0AS03070 [Zygosaccharomyces rouxii]|uniref:RRM domain-containing protein n=1 Tax=Zygosaccharomyces rouxii TaxID=4956 RepID=A0A1Q3AGV7_ZYGRO|nr:hypothetical protein ZYGR_0AS03070 [Zygosaccharomyces rouxii]
MTASRNNGIPAYVYLDGKRNVENLQLNQTKPRVSSLSSFFSTSTMEDNGNHELFGFRRFARNYLLGSDKSTKFKTARQGNLPNEQSSYNCYAQVNAAPHQLQFRGNASNNKPGMNMDPEPSIRTQRLNVNGEMVDYELDVFGIPQKIPDLFQEDNVYTTMDGENACVTSSSEDELLENNVRPRAVVLGNIPKSTGIASILAQLHGGPLENIAIHTGDAQTLKKVQLDFLTHEAAYSFMKYGRTNMFKINGQHLTPEWGRISDHKIKKSNEWDDQQSSNEDQDFCRCLIMKKYINCAKRTKYSDAYKESPLEPLNLSEIKQDFGNFGEILEITPVVSRKLCISVNFFSMESAMKAMREYENPTSNLHKAYFDNWAIWYGKDITDRPCIAL